MNATNPLIGAGGNLSPTPIPAPVPIGTAILDWSAPAGVTPAAYCVYVGIAPGAYQQAFGSGLAAGTKMNDTVTSPRSQRTYYFAVTDIDANGAESTYSTEVSKAIP